MRARFVLPCVVIASVSLGGCGGGSSSSAAVQSSDVRASNLAAVAAGNRSPTAAAKQEPTSSSGAPSDSGASAAALVDAQGNPIIPAAARAHTDAGAIAFTKYYWSLLGDYGGHPRDPKALRQLSAKGCDGTCRGQVDSIKSLQNSHSRFESVLYRTSEMRALHASVGDTCVLFKLELSGGVRVDNGKRTPMRAYQMDAQALVRWENNGWRLVSAYIKSE